MIEKARGVSVKKMAPPGTENIIGIDERRTVSGCPLLKPFQLAFDAL
jgi:hypothetical protein